MRGNFESHPLLFFSLTEKNCALETAFIPSYFKEAGMGNCMSQNDGDRDTDESLGFGHFVLVTLDGKISDIENLTIPIDVFGRRGSINSNIDVSLSWIRITLLFVT